MTSVQQDKQVPSSNVEIDDMRLKIPGCVCTDRTGSRQIALPFGELEPDLRSDQFMLSLTEGLDRVVECVDTFC